MMRKYLIILGLFLSFSLNATRLHVVTDDSGNDLVNVLKYNKLDLTVFSSVNDALQSAKRGDAVMVLTSAYPDRMTVLTENDLDLCVKKNLRLFVEYPQMIPGRELGEVYEAKLERGVVTSSFWGPELPEMSILGLNGVHVIPVSDRHPLLALAKVAGFDHAHFGVDDVKSWPLIVKERNCIYALTKISDFRSSRFAPVNSWHIVIEKLVRWLVNDSRLELKFYPADPRPSYSKDAEVSESMRKEAVRKGAEWLWNGNLLIHPSWAKDYIHQYQTASNPNHFFGPPVSEDKLLGDGSFGVMEGHASEIYADGNQKYRYFIRADVQGEASMMMSAAYCLTGDRKYYDVAENLLDYLFYTSEFRGGTRGDRQSPSYGLLGWANTHLGAFFNDDNARCILGAIAASSMMDNQRWNQFIVENILANFRTCSIQGYQGGSLNEADIIENGWQFYAGRDYTNPHPHFESWMWACYLWLYDKCGYEPLLEKAKSGIRIMMENYPDGWHVQNGMQQERARMVLPLAWLVRVEDTPEHRHWLDIVVSRLLECQEPCGAIREELGSGAQDKNKILVTSNDAYGKNEAPLIAMNGDPVADMLYTCNFLFFALNEAAHATGNEKYADSVAELADFLVKIQIKSEAHKDIDGAWFRAFDYGRWDYWASNADDGWGAWSTLSGWIQSWIVTTEYLVDAKESYWDKTENMDMTDAFYTSKWMVDNL